MNIIKTISTIISIIFLTIKISSCQNLTNKSELGGKLDATAFEQKINTEKNIQLIDVRTPDEYVQGFIAKAQNIDWNDNNFEIEVAKLDKTKPTYIYCLAGGRSASAASKLSNLGFTQVYELKGGMNAWRNASKPVVNTTDNNDLKHANLGLSVIDFDRQIASTPFILVDVYAPWCGPCKKMAPYLAEIAMEKKEKLTFLKINADESQELVKHLNVEELPTIILYKNGKRVYTNIGLITKIDLQKIIELNLKNN